MEPESSLPYSQAPATVQFIIFTKCTQIPSTRMAVLLQSLFAQLVKKLPAFTKTVKAVSVHNRATHSKSKWKNGGVAPLILNLSTRFSFRFTTGERASGTL